MRRPTVPDAVGSRPITRSVARIRCAARAARAAWSGPWNSSSIGVAAPLDQVGAVVAGLGEQSRERGAEHVAHLLGADLALAREPLGEPGEPGDVDERRACRSRACADRRCRAVATDSTEPGRRATAAPHRPPARSRSRVLLLGHQKRSEREASGDDVLRGGPGFDLSRHRVQEVIAVQRQQLSVLHRGDRGRARHVAQEADLTEELARPLMAQDPRPASLPPAPRR